MSAHSIEKRTSLCMSYDIWHVSKPNNPHNVSCQFACVKFMFTNKMYNYFVAKHLHISDFNWLLSSNFTEVVVFDHNFPANNISVWETKTKTY